MTYDIQLIQEQNQKMEGFIAAGPVRRRLARGREEDSFLMMLSPRRGWDLDAAAKQKYLDDLVNNFFRTQGSVTMAMRAVLTSINEDYLAQNKQVGMEVPASLVDVLIAVIHHGTLFGAQAGQSYLLHLRNTDSRLYHAAWADETPLGQTSAYEARFFQLSLTDNDMLIFAPEFPSSWLENASRGLTSSLRSISNNIAQLGAGEFPMQAVRLSIGSGQVTTLDIADYVLKEKAESLRLREDARREAEERSRAEAAARAEEARKRKVARLEAEEAERLREEAEARTRLLTVPQLTREDAIDEELNGFSEAVPVSEEKKKVAGIMEKILGRLKKQEPLPLQGSVEDIGSPDPVLDEPVSQLNAPDNATEFELPGPSPEEPQTLDGPSEVSQNALRGIAAGAAWLNGVGEKTRQALDKPVLDKDGIPTPLSGISVMTKLLIAIIVPLIIVGITTAIYFSRGISMQFDRLMNQARAAINSAQSAKSPEQAKDNWQAAYSWLTQAATYKSSAELTDLKNIAEKHLQDMTGSKTLAFTKLIGAAELGPDASITEVLSIGNDIFLLDKNAGKVIHLSKSEKGFTLDRGFSCGAGKQQGKELGKLVAITQIPVSNKAEAPLLGVDVVGNIAYCKPGAEALVYSLQAPENGFGKIQKITYDPSSARLYVFAPERGNFLIYTDPENNFPKAPVAYFDNPGFKLNDVIDLSISKDESFYLFADGHSAHCQSSNVTGAVECQNPLPYMDARGKTKAEEMLNLNFTRLSFAPAPDAAIYYLSARDLRLYQFSLMLNLNDISQAMLASGIAPKQGITAFNFSADRIVYLASGSEVYSAPLP